MKLLVVAGIFITIAAPEWPAFQDERHRLSALVGLREFDFLVWEVNALASKGNAQLTGGHRYLERQARKETVLDYLDLVGQVLQMQAQINSIYADPSVLDPEAVSRDLREELEGVRAEQERMQAVAEAIIEEQVATVLAEEGFDLLGGTWPPVRMHMTPLPLVLVVSPREKIQQIYTIPLLHGLSVADQEILEGAVYNGLGRSALVVPIGGLGFYPAMIVETSNVNFLMNTVAHEWAHHWLTLHPLGIRYLASPTMRTINETVASIVGEEVGLEVVARYYPELMPSETATSSEEAPAPLPEEPLPFDFRAEMRETRIGVDELLAQGRVEAAEAYMEERRQLFVEKGFSVRKLNQAYFAFYGAYADEPGATGADPVGPIVVALRERSPSLIAFMTTVARVTNREALEEAQARLP